MGASSEREKQWQDGGKALHAGNIKREYGTQELRKLKLGDGYDMAFFFMSS
jgi:hypothetical protein